MDEHREVRALAIDDDPDSRETFKRLANYGVRCVAIPPPNANAFQEQIFARIELDEVDVVLLDFRLDDQASEGEPPVSYRGAMLAAAIKEKFPTPIVLVTTEAKLREYVIDNSRIRTLFDHRLLKSEVGGSVAQRRGAAAQITDIARGFRRIRDSLDQVNIDQKPRGSVYELLEINEDELRKLEEQLRAPVPEKATEFASWLLQGILAYPGPLLDAAEAGARLGLEEEALTIEKIRDWARTARYRGAFGDLHPRWWEGRLLGLLQKTAGETSFGEAKARVEAISKACGETQLKPAKCTFCESGLVQRVCHVCKGTVDATHHLAARVDDRPPWALPAIVCFRCIRTGRDEIIPIRFGPGSRNLVDELKKME